MIIWDFAALIIKLGDTIDVSENGTDWTTVVNKTNYAVVAGKLTYSFSFPEQICRFVRISATKLVAPLSENNYYLIFTELSVNGKSSKIDLSTNIEADRLQSTNSNRMMGWDPNGDVIQYSHSIENLYMGGTGKGYLIDGDKTPAKWVDGTGYVGNGLFVAADNFLPSINTTANVNEWIQINLQAPHEINQFAFYGFDQTTLAGFPTDFTIDVSSTGLEGSWTTVVTKTGYSQPAGKSRNSFDFDPISCQYVRFNVTKIGAALAGLTATYDLALSEIEIMEYWGDIAPPPPITGRFITSDNENFRYMGRWEHVGGDSISYWGLQSVEIAFTGTNLYLVLEDDASLTFFYMIDGGNLGVFQDVGGKVKINSSPLTAGTHQIRIITPNTHDPNAVRRAPFKIKGIILDEEATTVPVNNSKKVMEIVGDSISDGFYGNIVGGYASELLLGMNSYNIAYAGITLSNMANYTGTSVGIDRQYFKLTNILNDVNAPDWDFDNYQPDAIMINLGTNDYERGATEADFKITYKNFLLKVREKNLTQ